MRKTQAVSIIVFVTVDVTFADLCGCSICGQSRSRNGRRDEAAVLAQLVAVLVQKPGNREESQGQKSKDAAGPVYAEFLVHLDGKQGKNSTEHIADGTVGCKRRRRSTGAVRLDEVHNGGELQRLVQ
jgi:hypothetical protein